MSFNVTKSGKPGDVLAAIHADTTIPDGVKDFVVQGVNALMPNLGERTVTVQLHGHMHDGSVGNYEPCTASITVKPDEAAAITEQSKTKVAAEKVAKEA